MAAATRQPPQAPIIETREINGVWTPVEVTDQEIPAPQKAAAPKSVSNAGRFRRAVASAGAAVAAGVKSRSADPALADVAAPRCLCGAVATHVVQIETPFELEQPACEAHASVAKIVGSILGIAL